MVCMPVTIMGYTRSYWWAAPEMAKTISPPAALKAFTLFNKIRSGILFDRIFALCFLHLMSKIVKIHIVK